MGFWGAVEETVVGGAAGAVGLAGEVPVYGLAANAAATAIHGVDAAAHGIAGDTGTAAREGAAAGAAALPVVGGAAAYADLGQAAYNTGVAVNNAAGGHAETTGEMINEGAEGLWHGITSMF